MRIRKFNESESSDIDMEYIHECFVEMLDNYDVRISEFNPYNSDVLFTLDVEIKIELSENDLENASYDMPDILSLSSTFSDLLSISEVAIEKIKTKYDIKPTFNFFKNDGEDEKYYFTIQFKY